MSIEDVSTCRRPHHIFHNKAAISKIRIKEYTEGLQSLFEITKFV